jgi:DNA-binding NarL/FixJ family response regulator
VREKRQNVLIVEDCPKVRQALNAFISEIEGLTLAGWAGDVRRGREALRQLRPDILILDIQLPGGSGMELLKSFGAGEPRPLAVIVFSGVGASYRRTCLEIGADFFFDKPLDFGLLDDLLHKLAANPPG